MIEYAIPRLAALKGRFLRAESLEKIAGTGDVRTLISLLSKSVFEKEIDTLLTRGESGMTLPAILRVVYEGHLRLRLFFSRLVKTAYPHAFDLILIRWEMEEVKAALRYLCCEGAVLERRFRFTSYVLEVKSGKVWEAHQTVPEFMTSLLKAEHPLAIFLDPDLYSKDRGLAEIEMERACFQKYLPEKIKLVEQARQYFADRVDVMNIQNALLVCKYFQDKEQIEQYYIHGPGRITLSDFQRLAKTSLTRAGTIIEKRLGIKLPSTFDHSLSRFSLVIRRSLLYRYRITNIVEGGGVWAFLFFMEDLDVMVSDLKSVIYYAAAGVAPEKIMDLLYPYRP